MIKSIFRKVRRKMESHPYYHDGYSTIFDVITPEMSVEEVIPAVWDTFPNETGHEGWLRTEAETFVEMYQQCQVLLNYDTVDKAVAKAAAKTGHSCQEIMALIGDNLLWFYNYGTVYDQALRTLSWFVRDKLGRDKCPVDNLEHRERALKDGCILKVQCEPEYKTIDECGKIKVVPARKHLITMRVF